MGCRYSEADPFHPESGVTMAGRGAPTFLKRQKEQKRAARALAKRAAKQARRESRAQGNKSENGVDEEVLTDLDELGPGQDDNPTD
jgi:hypothetical protein